MSPFCDAAVHGGDADDVTNLCLDPHCSHCSGSDPASSSSSSSSYSLFAKLDSLVELNDSDKLRRIIIASVKGFSIGAGLKGGLALFSILARLRRTRKPREFTNNEAITLALKETLRYGLFLGTFAGTFVSVDEIIAALGGHRRQAFFLSVQTGKWRALVAGLVAGPSMLLTGPNTQHTSLAIYILMRAAVLASRCGIKSKRFGKYCKPLTWKHGDIFLMCLSSSQILYVPLLAPCSILSVSYFTFSG
ncbi:hypothetical protein LINGRAHAP2_LOCUS20881 [Linum grandiflorum]